MAGITGSGSPGYTFELSRHGYHEFPRVTIPNAMQLMDDQGKLTLNETSYSFVKDQVEAFLEFVKNRVNK